MSGITLILVPPVTMVGAMVVWVQAWNWRAMPSGSVSSTSAKPSVDSSGSVSVSGKPSAVMKRRHTSWIWVAG